MAALEAPPVEVLPWLKSLPVAPEYHPTAEDFADPIAYILKIEEEASRYGICKIVPPLPSPSKKAAVANLARSLSTFTTRQQQIGFCARRSRPVQKPVWQSGERYTLPEFEAKARAFERQQLKKAGKKSASALEVETMFWKACADKPFSVEYANDMPGSAFAELGGAGAGETLEDTGWNMRGISRSNLSLLRFMKEEIPGVTSPMVYVAMMFSWFAWHVEDHDLHSLNYLHFGAGKTWYGVPRDAAPAFEEVVRVHGYGEEVNPLLTFAILGEKTTIMSPEVLLGAGVPCCRLVQNAGEFVVTFPRAYHTGFSHGFNCGEASNIATPGWLKVAKEAAIRRASICHPPMLSHFQLLYNLALTFSSSVPKGLGSVPRSSRLKDKKQGGEMAVKRLFVEDMIENNALLHTLIKRGSSCVLLPQTYFEMPRSSNSRIPSGYKMKVKSRLPLGSCSRPEIVGVSDNFLSNDVPPGRNLQSMSGFWSASGRPSLMSCEGKQVPCRSSILGCHTSAMGSKDTDSGESTIVFGDELFDHGLLSCVTCGVLSFACVAVIRPTEATAKHILSSRGNIFNDNMVGSDINHVQHSNTFGSDKLDKNKKAGLVDIVVQSGGYQLQLASEKANLACDAGSTVGVSALELLASNYGDSSDSDESLNEQLSPSHDEISCLGPQGFTSKKINHLGKSSEEDKYHESGCYMESCNLNLDVKQELHQSVSNSNLDGMDRNLMAIPIEVSNTNDILLKENLSGCLSSLETSDATNSYSKKRSELHVAHHSKDGVMDTSIDDQGSLFCHNSNRDVSRIHIFCLEHAVEVERQLKAIGGAEVLIICHPEYLKVEKKAKSLANELSIDYCWKNDHFKEATAEDEGKIQTAIDDEEAVPGNGDWAAKLGVNLYYSSSLSKSPLYSKQMPYNAIIYQLFGQGSPHNSPTKIKVYSSRRSKKKKKFVVAGRWCGKVWMSNQVHPYLVCRDNEEEEPSKELCYHSTDSASEDMEEIDGSATSETVKEKRVRKRKSPLEIVLTTKKHKRQKLSSVVRSEGEQQPSKPFHGNRRVLRSGSVKRAAPAQNELSKKTVTSRRKLDIKDETEDGPSSRLRKRPSKCKDITPRPLLMDKEVKKKKQKKFATNAGDSLGKTLERDEDAEYQCDMEGCIMGFSTKHDLILHKKNICLVKGCGKKFFSHKYLVQHRRVHVDDRPLKCPWKGCKMTFKWAWARTEHIRVHTGARPYVCKEPGCGQTFRFVSDFSRHKRKTGHSLKKKGKG